MRCNAYGAETGGGHPYGGLIEGAYVSSQPYCHNPAAHRFRWVCEHGHRGEIVSLCEQHYAEFTGDKSVPWNIRRDVRFCPRCASMAERPEAQHKCKVRLVSVS